MASAQVLFSIFLATITAIIDQILVPDNHRIVQPFRRNSLIYQSCEIPFETQPLREKNFHHDIAASELSNFFLNSALDKRFLKSKCLSDTAGLFCSIIVLAYSSTFSQHFDSLIHSERKYISASAQ